MKAMLLFIVGLVFTLGGVGGLEHNPPEVSVVGPTAMAFLGLVLMYLATAGMNKNYDLY